MSTATKPLGCHEADDAAAFGDDGTVTAAALRTAALRVAERLGPSAGDEVIVVCRDRAVFAAALFGAWEAGFTVALPSNVQPETVRELRQRPTVRTVLHDTEGPKGSTLGRCSPGCPSAAPATSATSPRAGASRSTRPAPPERRSGARKRRPRSSPRLRSSRRRSRSSLAVAFWQSSLRTTSMVCSSACSCPPSVAGLFIAGGRAIRRQFATRSRPAAHRSSSAFPRTFEA